MQPQTKQVHICTLEKIQLQLIVVVESITQVVSSSHYFETSGGEISSTGQTSDVWIFEDIGNGYDLIHLLEPNRSLHRTCFRG